MSDILIVSLIALYSFIGVFVGVVAYLAYDYSNPYDGVFKKVFYSIFSGLFWLPIMITKIFFALGV